MVNEYVIMYRNDETGLQIDYWQALNAQQAVDFFKEALGEYVNKYEVLTVAKVIKGVKI